jgi:hypothetical protein
MREIRNELKTSVGNPEKMRQLGKSMHRWKDTLKWISKKQDVRCGLDSSGSGQDPMKGSYENGKEFSCFIKGGALLDYLSKC